MNWFISYACVLFLWIYLEGQTQAFSYANSRIIGGNPAYAGQFPFTAAINVQTINSRFFCGGALLNDEWIITSGFCVDGATTFTIQLGSLLLEGVDSQRITLASSEYFLHPSFNPDTIEHDLGLIKLRMPIELNTYIQPIQLPWVTLYNDTPVYAVGWGQTSDSEARLSNNLQYVEGSVMYNGVCKTFYGNAITNNMACFQSNYNEGTCTGDIGGPMVEKLGVFYWVVAIASFISANGCESTDPSGYTKIFEYLDWIEDVTGLKP